MTMRSSFSAISIPLLLAALVVVCAAACSTAGPRDTPTTSLGTTPPDGALPSDSAPPVVGDPPTPVPTTGAVDAASILFVGHSLIGWHVPSMLQSLAQDAGRTHASESQIGNGGTIQLQWERAAEGVYARDVLATGRHDVLVTTEAIPLESNYRWSGTVDFAGRFYALQQQHRPGARFFVYETWHSRNEAGWRARIDSDRALWEQIVDELNAAQDGPDALLLPGGTALGRLVDLIGAGEVPGVTNVDALFDDDIHMSELGWYFIACVHYATIYRRSPVGLTGQTIDRFGAPFGAIAEPTARVLQQIAWDVVSTDARAGVAARP